MPPSKKDAPVAVEEATIKIVCNLPGIDAHLTTSAGRCGKDDPIDCPASEADRYIERGLAREVSGKINDDDQS